MTAPLRIGIAGLGTVGGGTAKEIQENAALLASRCGRPVNLVAATGRNKSRKAASLLDGVAWYDDAMSLASAPDVDVVVELIGGSDGVAYSLCKAALDGGKHVVTANKALLAHHGNELAALAEKKNVTLGYEAAVAGGVPIIKALREGLAGNRISRVYGIMNGTCNYILTAMRETKREFSDVLKEAQDLGYAEADPSFDVDGVDTAHKLAILTSVAFGCRIDFDAIHVEGIRHITALDVQFADELGYRIKLLGVAALAEEGIEQRVHPCMVPAATAIAKVEDVFNAVVVDGDYVGSTAYIGPGAGGRPTASAVVSDIADIARGCSLPTFGIPAAKLSKVPTVPMERRRGAYYMRLTLIDLPGVFADVAAILRDYRVSMDNLIQHSRAPGEAVPVVITIHETDEASLMAVLARIKNLDAVLEGPCMIRIETF